MTNRNASAPDITPAALDRALDLVRFLRDGCEWDAAQTPDSLLPYLIEEAHEVAEAVTARDDQGLPRELGDLLMNVAFQIVLAEERAAFTAEDVVQALERKMRRRHPHLYGDGPAVPWEQLKAAERAADSPGEEAPSVLAGLPAALDPLSMAHRIQDRVAAVGFDWPDVNGPLEKVGEELEEVRVAIASGSRRDVEEELGDLLFAMVNLTRLAGIHPTAALRAANIKFARRFEALEALAARRGIELGSVPLETLDTLWDEVKRAG